MIGFHRPVPGVYGRAFDNGQQVPLDSFTGNIRALSPAPADHLVNFIQKNDAGLFHFLDGLTDNFVHVNEILGFFLGQDFHGLRHLEFPAAGVPGKKAAKHILEIDTHLFHADVGKHLDGRHGPIRHIQIHKPAVQFSGSQHAPKLFPGGGRFISGGADQFQFLG